MHLALDRCIALVRHRSRWVAAALQTLPTIDSVRY
jgi:hypothetical protein